MGSQFPYICQIHDSIFNPLSLSNFTVTGLKFLHSPWNLKPSYHRLSFHLTHFNSPVLLFILMVTSILQPSQSIIHAYHFYYGFSFLSSLLLWIPWVTISTKLCHSRCLTLLTTDHGFLISLPSLSSSRNISFFIPFPRFLKHAERSKQKGPNKDKPCNIR